MQDWGKEMARKVARDMVVREVERARHVVRYRAREATKERNGKVARAAARAPNAHVSPRHHFHRLHD